MPNENTNENEIERRFLVVTQRATGDEKHPTIEGDAAVFNQETKIGRWFREMILPGAFKRVLSEKPDVIAAFNHNWEKVLGRTTAGTLSLEETEKGLSYVTDINPDDPEAMSVYQKVKRGDVSQASFAFTVRKEQWTRPATEQELSLRTIIEVDQLFDVGPCTFGAYPQASASARSQAQTFQQEEALSPEQAASSGAEAQVKARQAARRRTLELLSVKHPK